VFAGSRVISVGHTGSSLPRGTTRYVPRWPIKSLQTAGSEQAGAVVSLLSQNERHFLAIVSRDINAPLSLAVDFDGSTPAHSVSRVEKDGRIHPLEASPLKITIAPGDIAVLTWTD
jgi:hypothetical protein